MTELQLRTCYRPGCVEPPRAKAGSIAQYCPGDDSREEFPDLKSLHPIGKQHYVVILSGSGGFEPVIRNCNAIHKCSMVSEPCADSGTLTEYRLSDLFASKAERRH